MRRYKQVEKIHIHTRITDALFVPGSGCTCRKLHARRDTRIALISRNVIDTYRVAVSTWGLLGWRKISPARMKKGKASKFNLSRITYSFTMRTIHPINYLNRSLIPFKTISLLVNNISLPDRSPIIYIYNTPLPLVKINSPSDGLNLSKAIPSTIPHRSQPRTIH